MKNICLINGSLRGKEASSLVFLNFINRLLPDSDFHKDIVNVRAGIEGNCPEAILQTLARADAIIMVFPLFTYGLPGALMRLLEDFWLYEKGEGDHRAAGIYVVANCGFPRPQIMGELVRVMRNFSRRLSLNWRFAVCMGGGPVAAMAVKAPLLRRKYGRAFSAIASDIENGGVGRADDYFIKPVIPESVLLWIKARYEKKMKAGANPP